MTSNHASTVGTQLAENGRVLATLDDWRAMMFILVGVIIILVMLIIWDRIAASRRDAKVATALDSIAASMNSLTVEVKVMSRLRKGRVRRL